MTDLDTFRRALHGPDASGLPSVDPDAPTTRALDVGVIMAKGRRLRRRRRLAAATAVLCLAAAAFGAVTGISHLTRPSPALSLGPATSGAGTSSPAPVGPAMSAPPPSLGREGRVVPTGIRAGEGELVFYGVRVNVRQLRGITFGIMAGLRGPSGALTPQVETSETTGRGTAPGFHAIEAATRVGSPTVAVPEFGYYAGPAAVITARQGGQLVHASLARWSADPGIVIFWFPTTRHTSTPLTGLAAYTATGRQLPSGNTAAGHG